MDDMNPFWLFVICWWVFSFGFFWGGEERVMAVVCFFSPLYERFFFSYKTSYCPTLTQKILWGFSGSHQNDVKGDCKPRESPIRSIPFSRDKTSVTTSSIHLTHNMRTAAIVLQDLNGQNNLPPRRFQGVTDNLNTLSSLIICQLLSCFPPTVSVLLRSSQGSDFLSHPHIKSSQTWKVPCMHFRYNCSYKSTPPLLNAQKNKPSKKPAGQSISHHIRTAMPSYAELRTPKQGDGPLTKAVIFSSNLSSSVPRWPPWQSHQHQPLHVSELSNYCHQPPHHK